MRSRIYVRHLLRLNHVSTIPIRCAHQSRLFSTWDSIAISENAPNLLDVPSDQSTIDRDNYLFGEKLSFNSCGLSVELVSALEASGKLHPTLIQAKVITAVETGNDVIVGAETGSGKTLSYLLPIINGLLRECAGKSPEEAQQARSYPTAMIVVPNKELCSQVHRMASEILMHLPQHHDISIG